MRFYENELQGPNQHRDFHLGSDIAPKVAILSGTLSADVSTLFRRRFSTDPPLLRVTLTGSVGDWYLMSFSFENSSAKFASSEVDCLRTPAFAQDSVT